jgi:murein DD-endopeptidase MepM/ murein hydrolase activator NlpD
MAAVADRALSRGRRFRRATALSAALLASLALTLAAVDAQTLYRYLDGDGHVVYSDRRPDGLGRLDPGTAAAEAIPPGVRLRETTDSVGERMLVAVNDFESWVQVAYRVESSRNLDPSAPSSGNLLVPPRSQSFLMWFTPIDAASPVEVSFSYQYLHGHPSARHRPDSVYRLPYALNDAHPVSQAYPDTLTHASDANRHAVDFEMPVGTAVHAARAGIVVDLADEYFGAGLDLDVDVERANFVRILHDDGTLALYGHLNGLSVRVEPGERVAQGQHIADSGNSGFSSGPHLLFVVQRNSAGAMESVPVQFAGKPGSVVSLTTGDRPVAY